MRWPPQDARIAAERAHHVPRIERELATQALRISVLSVDAERGRAFRDAVEELLARSQLQVNVRRLHAEGKLDPDEVFVSPTLARALYGSFRDALDAVAPQSVPAFARIAAIYESTSITRAGRSLVEFLRIVDEAEWSVLERFADQFAPFIPFVDEVKDSHPMRVSGTDQGCTIRISAGPLRDREAKVMNKLGEPIALTIPRMLVRADAAVSNAVWHEISHAKLTGDITRALVYAVRGEIPKPKPF